MGLRLSWWKICFFIIIFIISLILFFILFFFWYMRCCVFYCGEWEFVIWVLCFWVLLVMRVIKVVRLVLVDVEYWIWVFIVVFFIVEFCLWSGESEIWCLLGFLNLCFREYWIYDFMDELYCVVWCGRVVSMKWS